MYKISIGVLCLILAVIFGNAIVVSGESDDETVCFPLGVIPLGPPEDVETLRRDVEAWIAALPELERRAGDAEDLATAAGELTADTGRRIETCSRSSR